LGWPVLLGEALPAHQAGQRLIGEPDRLFHRQTDDFVRAEIGKNPLEVGADRIARTAVSTLTMLERIRVAIGQEIPLAWNPSLSEGVFAIEVYPAGTLRAYGLPSSGYKKPGQAARRDSLISQISSLFSNGLGAQRTLLLDSADALDAVVCTISGADFLRGEVLLPNVHPEVRRKEGWIWVRTPTPAKPSADRTAGGAGD
jgi:hypothetical protein